MFDALEEMAQQHMDLENRLNEVKEIHQAKLVEREETEAECEEVCCHCVGLNAFLDYFNNCIVD